MEHQISPLQLLNQLSRRLSTWVFILHEMQTAPANYWQALPTRTTSKLLIINNWSQRLSWASNFNTRYTSCGNKSIEKVNTATTNTQDVTTLHINRRKCVLNAVVSDHSSRCHCIFLQDKQHNRISKGPIEGSARMMSVFKKLVQKSAPKAFLPRVGAHFSDDIHKYSQQTMYCLILSYR